ncbi:MAG: polysaccharide deacetylase family protein [Actinomadura rubrobrunea]|nr:polysaccharide deacetylase family protein [Actinomadura rubrobrunea]
MSCGMRRRLPGTRRGAVAAVLGMALLTGCAAQPATPTMVDGSGATIRATDPSAVPGLTAATRIRRDARRRIFAGYPQFPGVPELTKALADAVDAEVAPFLATTDHTPPSPTGDVPELNVRWSLAAASGDVAGVRLVTSRVLGTAGGESRVTLWYDGAARTVRPSTDLVDGPRALATLAQRVRERLGDQANAARVQPSPRLFSSMGFNAEGNLVVEFSDYTVAPGTAGRIAVVLDDTDYASLLSDFGQRARQAAVAYRPKFTAPPALSETPSARTAPLDRGPTAAARHVDCRRAKCVALTFDGGPGPDTGRLLDALAARGARATFFVVGANATVHRDVLRRAAAEGHEIGNQTQHHRDLTRLPALQVNTEVQRTQQVVRDAVGRAPTLLRPPYGATDGTVGQIAGSFGLAQALWNADVHDDTGGDARAIADRTVSMARPGAVLLLHDVRRPTVDAVPRVLDRLSRQGYTFVTVSELMTGARVPAGGVFQGLSNGR